MRPSARKTAAPSQGEAIAGDRGAGCALLVYRSERPGEFADHRAQGELGHLYLAATADKRLLLGAQQPPTAVQVYIPEPERKQRS
jgi:hypothetical protein